MKYILLPVILLIFNAFLFSQNVGINTNAPQKRLSVNGSIQVDQNDTNRGNLDSAALLLGSTNVGIISNKNPEALNYNGVDIWTGNYRRLFITSTGFVGINLNSSPTAFLDVNGTIRTRNSLTVNNSLYVHNYANISGNAAIDGKLVMGDNIVVGGKGLVKSNSATQLRMGFTKGSFGITLLPGGQTDIQFMVTPFTGDNNNIRVSISQFLPDVGSGDTWGRITMTVHSVNPEADRCTVRLFNGSSVSATMLGTLHLLSFFYRLITAEVVPCFKPGPTLFYNKPTPYELRQCLAYFAPGEFVYWTALPGYTHRRNL